MAPVVRTTLRRDALYATTGALLRRSRQFACRDGMPDVAVRHLYLTRHAEPNDDGELTERGVRQAMLLGQRLSDLRLTSVLHGPLPRAKETAQVVARQLARQVSVTQLDAVGDYIPMCPTRTRSNRSTGRVCWRPWLTFHPAKQLRGRRWQPRRSGY